MAAEIKVPHLPYESMSPNHPPSSSNSVPDDTEAFDFPLTPHQWFPPHKIINKYDKECSIHLEAKLSPKSKDPSISVHFTHKDHTKLLQITLERHVSYNFGCPLFDKPLVSGYTIKASRFCLLKIKTDDHPVKREHMKFFETQINRSIKELLDPVCGDICIDVEASIDNVLLPDEAVGMVKEMEGEGFRKDSCGNVECYDCAMCLDDVQMRWFQGMRLPCNHVFHVKCIAPWFEKKTTCPMCRRGLF